MNAGVQIHGDQYNLSQTCGSRQSQCAGMYSTNESSNLHIQEGILRTVLIIIALQAR
jgi:hypothetical protein